MAFFRMEKKKDRMQEKMASGEAQANAPEPAPVEEIRVTDRRRIKLDDEARAGVAGDDASGEASGSKPTYVEQLEARAEAAEQKLIEVQARFEQLRAELRRETDETRQRLNRAADERARREKADFIAGLLPVADNLQRAIETGAGGESLEALLEGVRGTANGFERALAAAGVESVPAIGQPFDPELHEAVDTIDVEPERDGHVTAEYSRGYKLGDRLLRPARVQVGRSQGEMTKAAE
ncbi:MAG: nucleotide exchange factor GrpE [Pyrinomonadaceae bacterium]